MTQHVTMHIYSIKCVEKDHVTLCKDQVILFVTLQNDSVKIIKRYQSLNAMQGARDFANSSSVSRL